ncbi:MAG TPA: TolC family protein, partial [Planctomycetaceae bacterium]|nr:TolC family protein [Planctomycetaceae bacterium]
MHHSQNQPPKFQDRWTILLSCVLAGCLTSCTSVESRSVRRSAAPPAPPIASNAAAEEAIAGTAAAAPVPTDAAKPAVPPAAAAMPAATVAAESHRAPASPVASPVGQPAPVHDSTVHPARGEQSVLPIDPDSVPDDPFNPPLPVVVPPSASPAENVPPAASAEVPATNAPLEAGDTGFPINLATALRLADARPLVVTTAQAGAWIAEAQLQRAQLIWVPTLNMGADYIRHDGFGPDFNRGLNTAERPLNQNVNFLYTGLGVISDFALTDAIFQPLAARQTLNSRRWDIQTAKNDALLATAKAYFDVHEARGKYAGALDVVRRTEMLTDRIDRLSEDLVPKVEVARARRMLATAQQNAAVRREKWRVSSANLTQVLRLDPRVVVEPAEPDHLQVTLIDPAR